MECGTVASTLKELAEFGVRFDLIVMGRGGVGNCRVEHGTGSDKGFGPERKATIRKNVSRGGTEWSVVYHRNEPRRITMTENRQVVDRVERVVREAQEIFLWMEEMYMTRFPQHVEPCCEE
jgi:hypothetical protein